MNHPAIQAERFKLLCSLSWMEKPCQRQRACVWRTGKISRSVTAPSKKNGTSHPPDISRALANVLTGSLSAFVYVCGGKSKQSAAFVFADYTNGLGADQFFKKVMPHALLESLQNV